MKRVTQSPKSGYRSALRKAQAGLTRERIQVAVAGILDEGGAPESITFKAVAARAGVTEMTVYRHFPTRQNLLQGLWEHLNQQMDPAIGLPANTTELRGQHRPLFAGFDRMSSQIIASITTPQGREMRAALNTRRRKAFMAVVDEVAQQLSRSERTRAAAVLQLLHSAYAWASLREQWGLSGREAGEATLWAIDSLLNDLKTRNARTKGEAS